MDQQHEFESLFKSVWADNADVISIQYSGTGALKTDFTRTGKRTYMGALQDLTNSVTRYYKNNFMDGFRQVTLWILHLITVVVIPKEGQCQNASKPEDPIELKLYFCRWFTSS